MTAMLNRGPTRRYSLLLLAAVAAVPLASGCRQKMAEMPLYKPYEPTDFFSDGRSNRPLERGVIHRAQHLESDPLVTGLTREEWGRFYALQAKPITPAPLVSPTPIENREEAIGAPRFDPRDPTKPKIYLEGFPFEITEADLRRGEARYSIYCAVCHGAYGNGQGKIWERGYLTPTSFHTTPVTKDDLVVQRDGVWYEKKGPSGIPLGYSRGYALWGIQIPLREVPVGYFFEVITKGYGGMPSYSAQIPPADRWRIIAYIRVLQLSQHASAADLPDAVKTQLNAGGPKP
jgi:mono/diheme cytochrome c family protein